MLKEKMKQKSIAHHIQSKGSFKFVQAASSTVKAFAGFTGWLAVLLSSFNVLT